jgi:hypothetical protein
MSLKEFDAKQFLLEKGERVGLGIAVTLMVLMLILNLFMPDKGFFSGSPKTKETELKKSTETLDNGLRTRQPGPSDLPEKGEGRLIAFDTSYLQPDSYAPEGKFFEPRIRENPARRPPKIYNVDEAVVAFAHVPIDTYLFDRDFKKIWVLVDKEGKRSQGSGGQGGFNPFARLGNMPGGMPGGGMMGGGMQQQMQQRMMQQNQGRLQGGLQGARQMAAATDTQEYETRLISFDSWNPQELTAHQLRPLRMAIIAGSFPYKEQLEEHKNRLRLPSIDAVLNEEVATNDDKKAQAFRFLGMDVERKEVDANGKTISDWARLPLAETYQLWLKHTFYPFEPEDPKLEQVRFPGLAMPLLREFHASKASAPGIPGMQQMMGMMQRQMPPGASPPGGKSGVGLEEAAPEGKTHYPNVVEKLPRIRATLAKLNETQPKQIAAPKRTPATILDAFNPDMNLGSDQNAPAPPPPDPKQAGPNAGQEYIPEYVLARAVDVNIEPGKFYRYRMRIRMANPNYKRSDVASPDYKENEVLESKEWKEIEQTVSVPQETFYFVADEKQGATRNDMRSIPMESAQNELWRTNPGPDQVAMQFQRWVESTQRSRKDTDMVYVGEWAVADRVLVARGEYIGRKVKVDLPIWIYTRNSFILPIENPKDRVRNRVRTGIDVDFGQENPENNMILVDFEGGKVSSQSPKVDDNCALEVLMLSPDGKLLARNNIKDTKDGDRTARREEAMKRIQDVREGKKE